MLNNWKIQIIMNKPQQLKERIYALNPELKNWRNGYITGLIVGFIGTNIGLIIGKLIF